MELSSNLRSPGSSIGRGSGLSLSNHLLAQGPKIEPYIFVAHLKKKNIGRQTGLEVG